MANANLRLPSFKTLWLRAVGCTDLDPTAKLIALTIGAFMDTTAKGWPSLVKIAERASISERTIRRRLPDLVDADILTIRKGGGRGLSNVYQGWIPGHLVSTFPRDFPEELIGRMVDTCVWNPGGYVDTGSANVDSGAANVDSGAPKPGHQMSKEVVEVVEVQHLEVPDDGSSGVGVREEQDEEQTQPLSEEPSGAAPWVGSGQSWRQYAASLKEAANA